MEQLVTKLSAEVKKFIGGQFPDSVTYDESLFTNALGGQGSTDLESVRDKIAKGITIDADDLLGQFSDKDQTADLILEMIQTDHSYTQVDFDRYREERAANQGTDDLNAVDTFRGTPLGLVLGPLGAAIATGIGLLLLFIIGILGGQSWTSRLIWAASAMAFSALILWLAFTQVIGGVGADFATEGILGEIETQIAEKERQDEPIGMLVLVRDEGVEKLLAIGDAITGKFAGYVLLWLAVGVIAIIAAIAIRMTGGKKAISYSGQQDSIPTSAP
jgi:hypothetical protein